jgi:hypothetical protein
MKKIIFLLIISCLMLGVSSCKRSEVNDPPWDGPAGFNILVEGSVTPALQVIDGRIHTSQIYVKVTDSKGNPLTNKPVFIEQLKSVSPDLRVDWGYFANNDTVYMKATDGNGEVRVTFYWPIIYHSEEMWIHALVVIDGRAFKGSEQLNIGNIPQDFISLAMFRGAESALATAK